MAGIFRDGMLKGLSPLIAAVVLIVITVSLAGIISAWLSSFAADSNRRIENRTLAQIDCTGASLKIGGVYYQNGSTPTVRAIIENNGYTNGLLVIGAQVYNTTGHNFSAANTPLNINHGELVTLMFNNVSFTNCTAFSKVSVVTACAGIEDESLQKPLGC